MLSQNSWNPMELLLVLANHFVSSSMASLVLKKKGENLFQPPSNFWGPYKINEKQKAKKFFGKRKLFLC